MEKMRRLVRTRWLGLNVIIGPLTRGILRIGGSLSVSYVSAGNGCLSSTSMR